MNAELLNTVMYMLVGISLQICMTLYPMRPGDWRSLKWLTILPLLCLIKFEDGPTYLLEAHIVIAIASFVLAVICVFHDRFLPRLAEASIIFVGVVFIYAIGIQFGWSARPVLILSLIFAAIFVVLCLRLILPLYAKASLYAGFLAMIFCIGILQFRFADFAWLVGDESSDIPIENAIADGMLLVFLVGYFFFLCRLVPIADKHARWGHFFDDWRAALSEMVERFSDYQAHPLLAVYIVVLLVSILYGNISLQLVDHWLLINVLLVFHPAIIGMLERLMYNISQGLFHWQPIIEQVAPLPKKPRPKGKLLSNEEIDVNRFDELARRRQRRVLAKGGRKRK